MDEKVEETKSIGCILREAREAKNLTIEDVAKATSFRVDALKRIEADDYTGFNGMIYVKGTIRGYGNYLGLNGLLLVEQFKLQCGNLMAKKDTGDKTQQEKIKEIQALLKQEPGVGTQKSYIKEKEPLPILQIICGVCICALVVFMYFNVSTLTQYFGGTGSNKVEVTQDINKQEPKKFGFTDKIVGMYETVVNLVSETHSDENSKKDEVQPVVEAKPVVIPEAKKAEPAAVPEQKAATQPAPVQQENTVPKINNSISARYDKVVVEMTANGQCWIDVFADGKAVYSGMMTKGRYKIFEANKRVTVKYGNIGVMQVVVNGRAVNMKGEAGVATKHYPR